jgi:hypothetical protein
MSKLLERRFPIASGLALTKAGTISLPAFNFQSSGNDGSTNSLAYSALTLQVSWTGSLLGQVTFSGDLIGSQVQAQPIIVTGSADSLANPTGVISPIMAPVPTAAIVQFNRQPGSSMLQCDMLRTFRFNWLFGQVQLLDAVENGTISVTGALTYEAG